MQENRCNGRKGGRLWHATCSLHHREELDVYIRHRTATACVTRGFDFYE